MTELDLTGLVGGQLDNQADHQGDGMPPDVAEIISPIDGQCVELTDVDGMIDLYERLDRHDREVYAAKLRIRETLAGMTEGDAKTRRVRGQRRTAKIEMPDDSWDNSILKEAWEAYPKFRDQYLRIEKVAPKLREVKKMIGTSGPEDFQSFRDMVTKANRGPTGTATVKVEV